MFRQLPNTLTVLRLVLAGLFFLILNQYRYPGGPHKAWWLGGALVLFILAAVTDALDGYLARRWHVESTFGRIMDPFCDKVLILGAFIYLCGPRFVFLPDAGQGQVITTVSGVYPWMVALMLARELLVTSVRGEAENAGVQFGANRFGKLKMVLQSVGVPVILIIVWVDPLASGYEWLRVSRDVLVYLIVVVTVLSGLPYLMCSISLPRCSNTDGSIHTDGGDS